MRDIEELGITKQRQAVLLVIRESMAHLTANEVFAAAKVKLPTISFATVYNSLRYLKRRVILPRSSSAVVRAGSMR